MLCPPPELHGALGQWPLGGWVPSQCNNTLNVHTAPEAAGQKLPSLIFPWMARRELEHPLCSSWVWCLRKYCQMEKVPHVIFWSGWGQASSTGRLFLCWLRRPQTDNRWLKQKMEWPSCSWPGPCKTAVSLSCCSQPGERSYLRPQRF